ncbi:hypothetical protein [Pseudoalteromonas sp. MMG022]|uniref:hypothetical protein n=1 Tax=Pseudoalteromonas sp. MMG022 TaxID=2909978 RepID=UPI001F2FC1D3|nr:hypothetical protein [Pseudoalteromonas sp. MMG022]MCF6437015.1 hypothetical protein [Pseudoalteromonas sp. MMG022]
MGNSIVSHHVESAARQKYLKEMDGHFAQVNEQRAKNLDSNSQLGGFELEITGPIGANSSFAADEAYRNLRRQGVADNYFDAGQGAYNQTVSAINAGVAAGDGVRSQLAPLSAAHTARYASGDALAAYEMDRFNYLANTGSFNSNHITSEQWQGIVNNRTRQWASELQRDVISAVGGIASAPLLVSGGLGLAAWGVRGLQMGSRSLAGTYTALGQEVGAYGLMNTARSVAARNAHRLGTVGMEGLTITTDIIAPGAAYALPVGGGLSLAYQNADELKHAAFRLRGSENYGVHSTLIDNYVTGMQKAPLPSWIEESFLDDTFRTVRADTDLTLYRVFGGHAEAGGGFVSTLPAGSRIQSKIDAALLPEWKNSRMYEAEIIVPKGSVLSIGKVKPQTIQESSYVLDGMADQVLLPQDWPLEWINGFRYLGQ